MSGRRVLKKLILIGQKVEEEVMRNFPTSYHDLGTIEQDLKRQLEEMRTVMIFKSRTNSFKVLRMNRDIQLDNEIIFKYNFNKSMIFLLR